jgi:hypothetical protein
MRFGPSRMSTQRLLAGIMLAAFLGRALIPPGFMPAHATPPALAICPEGFPASLLGHAAHHGGANHAHTDHCVFGGGGASAPAPQPANLSGVWLALQPPVRRPDCAPLVVRLIHLPEARGPPPAA